ncbi:MAG: M61 family metallopeptidase [Gammaproteobacteria bacterium]|nr:M61 family metallopeptidase [Gammaproteobacteria bacterium]
MIPAVPEAHLYEVHCRIKNPDPAGQYLSLPAWIPGSYMIRDFAKNIVQLSAETETGRLLVTTRKDKSTWAIEACTEDIIVSYQIYAWDLSVRSAHLDNTHAYFNGSSVFLQVHGQENQACSVELQAPQSQNLSDWQVATSLCSKNINEQGFGLYQANNYDDLIDHPVEMGNFSRATFDAGGIVHEIVISGRHDADMLRLCQDLTRICEQHIRLFGELPAIERYVFLIMVVDEGYGGLEHRASTSLLCSRDDLPRQGENGINDHYRSFLGLCSHEYFHTWNIKRIKPAVFSPYHLAQESYTRQLWAFEGITSYYDDLALLRSGLISLDSYLELLGQTATRVWRGQGRFIQSVADSSFDAWTKFYKQDENAPNAIVSYYAKGALLALALDMQLRNLSDNQISLDDLMRLLWQEYGKPGRGLAEGEIESLAAGLIGDDLSDFFQRYLYGREDLPLNELLAIIAIKFQLRPADSADDKGGKAAANQNEKSVPAWLGARLSSNPAGARISHVFSHSPAMQAGLSAGDLIIAVNELKMDKQKLEKMLIRCQPGTRLRLHAFRRDELMRFDITLTVAPEDTCYFLPLDTATVERKIIRDSWKSA